MIRIEYYSKVHHLKQIFTGFHLFCEKVGEKLKLVDCSKKSEINTIACLVYYAGKKIAYDVQDGYQDFESMQALLKKCDYYFKRSYSEKENVKFANKINDPQAIKKMYPLGFNYDVTYDWCPINDGVPWKETIKKLLGFKNPANAYFKKQVFEQKPNYNGRNPVVFFQTRLWDIPDYYPQWKKEQWSWINETRLTIVRALKKEFGTLFDGGLIDTPTDRKLARDLIIPVEETDRKIYIEKMKRADICIGTTGLHMSIGGKTGEYIAASRAIVHEKFYYEVTGNFENGRNYLEFSNSDECITAVHQLIDNPDLLLNMQNNNHEYYLKYLEPCRLIENTIELIG